MAATRKTSTRAKVFSKDGSLLEGVEREALQLIEMGMKPERALLACGIGVSTVFAWRDRAANGDEKYLAFFGKALKAEAEGEARDLMVTAKAAWPERKGQHCGKCGAAVEVDLGEIEGTQRLYAMAAQHAMERLSRRFPARWSPTARVAIADEHQRFLDLSRRTLPPETFQLLLNAYISEVDSDAAA